jgi:hypothetical protein
MNARASLLSTAFLLASAATLPAGEPSAKDAITVAPTSPPRWRIGLGYAPLLGLKAEFSGLGTFGTSFAPQPTGGGQDYNYDDGYVHVDSSGNLGDQTWNWGYENDAQYDPSGGGSISYTLARSLGNAGVEERDDAKSGVEAYGYFDMGAVRIPGFSLPNATWGFRTGLHYAHIDIKNGANLRSATSVLTDRFGLGGVIPPLAPYQGSFNGPGPLISDSPDRSLSQGAFALVTGGRELDVHLTTLSLGSYLEIPLAPAVSLTVEGGFNAALASGSYDFVSNTTVTGVGTRRSSGSDSGTSILPGMYLGLSGIYQINESWAIQAAGRYQYLDDYDLGANGSSANLSFDSAFILSLGMMHSF